MKKIDLAYIAGLFDGEGCIQIIKTNGRGRGLYNLRCSLEMTNEGLPKLLQAHFGGGCRRRNLPLPRQNQWEWTTVSRMAYSFLRAVYPYLRLKKGEADIAIKFQEAIHIGSTRLTEKELVVREAQRVLLSSLKKKQ